jgi:Family of unknown function (DUF5718)
MLNVSLDDLRGAFGFGVAGNFAGHLEQAGEAADFAAVMPDEDEAPKGIFPWFVPGASTFLGVFPLSHDRIARPEARPPASLQLEPEVGLLCTVGYAADGSVAALTPRGVGAFNDCSIRRPGAAKISEKKNWGADSKGVAASFFAAEDLDADGAAADLRLACFLRRDDDVHAYGIDSPLPGYSYFGRRLLDWMVDRLNGQTGAPGTPLENVGGLLAAAGSPATALIGIGATRYTDYGETTFLRAGDEAIVVVYDGAAWSVDGIAAAVAAGDVPGGSVLRQTVYDGR